MLLCCVHISMNVGKIKFILMYTEETSKLSTPTIKHLLIIILDFFLPIVLTRWNNRSVTVAYTYRITSLAVTQNWLVLGGTK